MSRIYAQLLAAAAVVLVAVAVAGSFASRNVAEREAVNDAAKTTELLAESVVQPALLDSLLTGDAAAYASLDETVRSHVLNSNVVRVKVWKPDGTIIYSDEKQVVGSTFALGDDEQDALSTATTHAEVSDLTKPENRFEHQDSKLLEVYRPVWTPNGSELLFETYLPYDAVAGRTSALWRGFAGITLTSLLLLLVLMLPIIWRLLDRVRAAQEQRVALLEHAVDASTDERRRIAATLHDGVVQELAAASFAVSGAAERAESDGHPETAEVVRQSGAAVRGTIGSLRTLLVDIYPPNLSSAGLVAALTDLANTARTRDINVRLETTMGRTGLDEDGERLVYRVAQECLRNAVRHSGAAHIDITLALDGTHVVLVVADDGRGFDVQQTFEHPHEGHFGVQVMSDLAARSGAQLEVSSSSGEAAAWTGTAWRLTVPRA
jgi:signal transduction histidine kinase